jgi:hypothetical protein
MPSAVAEVPEGTTRRFWLTVRTPTDTPAGLYKGTIVVRPVAGPIARIPLEFRVCGGRLDPPDVPAGPFDYRIGIPWYPDDPRAAGFNRRLNDASLRKLREYGFTACSGMPSIAYRGFRGGKPILDFGAADAEMKRAKDLGFLAVVTYGAGLSGIDAYHEDASQMAAAGFKD